MRTPETLWRCGKTTPHKRHKWGRGLICLGSERNDADVEQQPQGDQP